MKNSTPSSTIQPPTYLMLGHITRDKISNKAILGGTASYSALTAHRLKQNVAIITSFGPDLPALDPLADISIKHTEHLHSTTFENIYFNGHRRQKWHSSAKEITYNDVPPTWRNPPIVHFGPIAQEVSPTLCQQFPQSLVCATVQGWLRDTDAEANVIYSPNPNLIAGLQHVDILVVSLADAQGNRQALDKLLNQVKIGVETVGSDGCFVYYQGRKIHIPVEPEDEVDPTGAGDIFAAAFFIRYQETQDPLEAGRFANACASLSLRKLGLDGIPTLDEVKAHKVLLYQ